MVAVLVCLPTAQPWQIWTHPDDSPGARDGHSLHVFNNTIILFGGRNNEILTEHHPKTFETERVNGTLRFKSYLSKSVVNCGQLTPEECYNITVGRFYNDVWTYPLTCNRAWDTGCIDNTWTELESGAALGGCTLINNREVCTHPQERFGHISAVFPDGRLLVYGGFSRLCEDYCSDIWSLDLSACMRTRAPRIPHSEYPKLATARGTGAGCKWKLMERLNRVAPGRRWRMASAQVGNLWFFFGGHRLWHGFSPTNSLQNLWLNRDKFDYGGIFDDLWVLAYNGSDASVKTPAAPGGGGGGFKQIFPKESCYDYPPTLVFEERYDIVCTVHWPRARAQAALVASPVETNSTSGEVTAYRLYMHGGYTVPFPYPHALGKGAGMGVASLGVDGPRPFPSQPYFLGDLWTYESSSGLWRELHPVGIRPDGGDGPIPSPRFGHSLTIAGSVLFLFGGRSYSDILGDTWLYNTVSGKWVYKPTHVHPLYPPGCTSDVQVISVPSPGIVGWEQLAAQDARPTTFFPGDDGLTGYTQWDATQLMYGSRNVTVEVATSMSVQLEPTRDTLLDGNDGRWTDPVFLRQPRRQAPGWDGCRDRADLRTDLPAELQWVQPSQRFGHTVVFAADLNVFFLYGGEAYVQAQQPSEDRTFPSANVAELWYFSIEHCANNCSYHGRCDFGHCACNDGWYGSDCSNASCPGDFCSYDPGSFTSTCIHCASLPHVHGLRRLLADPSINQAEAFRLVFRQQLEAAGEWDDALLDPEGDVYQHIARKSQLDFSLLSFSSARTRYLFDGTYDTRSDPKRWPRGRNAALEAALRVQHGECNGFGQCVCAPPFLGDDCSIKGCTENCYGHGTCVVEYPVARCDCFPPYGGADCNAVVCPNNCSFPNGVCQEDGTCACAWILNPYNRTQNFTQFAGDDCSFVQPFSAGAAPSISTIAVAVAVVVAAAGFFL